MLVKMEMRLGRFGRGPDGFGAIGWDGQMTEGINGERWVQERECNGLLFSLLNLFAKAKINEHSGVIRV